MDEILNEFEQFIEQMCSEYSIPHSGGTFSGMLEKVKQIKNATEELNDKAVVKANEILNSASPNIDRGLLKEKLTELGATKIHHFIVGSFN